MQSLHLLINTDLLNYVAAGDLLAAHASLQEEEQGGDLEETEEDEEEKEEAT